ncbi:MAG: IS4 family transposase [Candidatus Pacearchaeota archaeon]|nr:IS4 family transposase [Candidatus Pacearchaeota archaeon]
MLSFDETLTKEVTMKPAKHKFTLLKQVVETIDPYLVPMLARKHGVDKRSRTFSPWSHVVSMIFAHLTHALSLNDVCDTLQHHRSALATIRNSLPPSRNGLSHANKVRSSELAKDLFYETLGSLTSHFPKFGRMDTSFKLPRRIKRMVNIVDSTTIQLFANCMNWAKHRRRKAAAKCHLMLDAQTFLPRFAIVKSAASHDAVKGRVLCNHLQDGEIVIFDKAYVDFKHLFELTHRGVTWITRAKTNMAYKKVRNLSKKKIGNIISDSEIKLTGVNTQKAYPEKFRLIIADVLRGGKMVRMEFITDNFDFAAFTICELYKARWDIELFFKQLKQTLKLSDFLGYSENAVQWQVWSALLTYVILRFIAFMSKWKGTFARLFTTIRGSLWSRFDLYRLLELCGTAPGQKRMCMQPQQLYLPLFGV